MTFFSSFILQSQGTSSFSKDITFVFPFPVLCFNLLLLLPRGCCTSSSPFNPALILVSLGRNEMQFNRQKESSEVGRVFCDENFFPIQRKEEDQLWQEKRDNQVKDETGRKRLLLSSLAFKTREFLENQREFPCDSSSFSCLCTSNSRSREETWKGSSPCL